MDLCDRGLQSFRDLPRTQCLRWCQACEYPLRLGKNIPSIREPKLNKTPLLPSQHIIFGALIRSSFGPIGALWPVFNRTVMSIIWYGVQAYIGGESTFVLITAIWPSFATMPNTIPNSGTSTNYLISFLLFSAVSLIPIWFPIHKVKVLFTIKAIVAPAAGFGLLVSSSSSFFILYLDLD